MNKKVGVGIMICGLTVGLMACGGESDPENVEVPEEPAVEETPIEENQEQSDEAAFNTDDIPEVVATVNGEEIEKELFVSALEQQANMYAAQGMDLTSEDGAQLLDMLKQNVVEQLVNQNILLQAVEEEGLEATEEEIDAELTNQMEMYQIESEEKLEQALSAQNFTIEQFRTELGKEVRVSKFIDLHVEESKVSEEELQAAYDEIVAMSEENEGNEVPSFDEYKDQLEKDLKQQKQQEQLAVLVEELREKGDVTIHM